MSVILGIDLGTTNSLVAVMRGGLPSVLEDAEGRAAVPSVITVEGDSYAVGFDAREGALDRPESTIFSVKRLMGRNRADLAEDELRTLPFEVSANERGLAAVRVAGRDHTPEQLSSLILRELKARAESALGVEVSKAVITVPAYFDDAQRMATRVAGQAAGLEVVRIVNEPTAAALAYGLDREKGGCIVVYDLGGGTFDVSVLDIQDGLFRVRATAGDTHLGGDDFDRFLIDRLLQDVAEPDARLLQAAKQAAEAAKIHLSEHEVVEASVVDRRDGRTLSMQVTRADFEQWITPLVERTLTHSQRAMRDAGVASEEVRAVVLVGGSTRVPLVRREVERAFGRRPYTGVDPDRVVAIGAAVQADILAGGTRDTLLLDVAPLSLGIETHGGGVAKVLMRNSPIPAQATDTFTTSADRQTAIVLHVLQGERELAADCRSLGRFKLAVPPALAGMARVDVQFLVDENGVLNVLAKDRDTGAEAGIEVVPSYGLTDEEIARVVQESVQFARQDMAAHQLLDLRHACRTMIQSVDRLFAVGDHGLTGEETEAIHAARKEVEASLETDDVRLLKGLYDRFTEVTVPLAGQVMTEVAQTYVRGKTVDEVLADDHGETPKECGDLGEDFRASKGRTQTETAE